MGMGLLLNNKNSALTQDLKKDTELAKTYILHTDMEEK